MGVPQGWQSGIVSSQVDITVGMRVASDDHYLRWFVCSGYLETPKAKAEKQCLRFSAKTMGLM